MILTKQFLKDLNPSNMIGNTNADIQTSLNNRSTFKNIVKTFGITDIETTNKFCDIVKRANSSDYLAYCDILCTELKPHTCKEYFIAIQMINLMLELREEFTEEQFYKILCAYKIVDTSDSTCCGDGAYNSATDGLLKMVGTKLTTIKASFESNRYIDSSEVSFKPQREIDKLQTSIAEAVSIRQKVSADAGADGFNQDAQNNIQDLIAYVKDNLYYLDSDGQMPKWVGNKDYFIWKMKDIPAFTSFILGGTNTDENYLRSPIWLVAACHDAVRGNYKCLQDLYNVLCSMESSIYSTTFSTFEAKEISKEILSFIETIKTNILDEEGSIESGNTECNPLVEMGFGYFYQIIPCKETLIESEADEALNKLYKASISENSLAVLQESITILNEGSFKDTWEFAKKKRLDKYEKKKADKEAKEARKKELLQHEEDRKRQIKEEDEDRELARQREEKDRLAQIKSDRSVQKIQDKYDSRDARKTMLAEKLRALPLTSTGFYKANEALNRAVMAAIAAGGASIMGLNPVVGACLYLIPKYLNSKTNGPVAKGKERSKAIGDINSNIERLEVKINEAERKNNQKLVSQLTQMKTKLEHTRSRIAADSEQKGGAIIL